MPKQPELPMFDPKLMRAAKALGAQMWEPADPFERTLSAVASHNRRKAAELTPEQEERQRRAAKRNDPRHQKALAKRRKRKRGGPK